MDKIRWCAKKGNYEIDDINDNLSRAYLMKAENALRAAAILGDNLDWQVSSAYYAMYFGLYSVMMKIGIKCENHSCSIEFMDFTSLFSQADVTLLRKSQKARIDAQYYSDRDIPVELINEIVSSAPLFVSKCRKIGAMLTENDILNQREKLARLIQNPKQR